MNGGSEDRAGGITGRLSSLWNTSTDKDDTCVTWGLVSRGLFSYYTIKGWMNDTLLLPVERNRVQTIRTEGCKQMLLPIKKSIPSVE